MKAKNIYDVYKKLDQDFWKHYVVKNISIIQ